MSATCDFSQDLPSCFPIALNNQRMGCGCAVWGWDCCGQWLLLGANMPVNQCKVSTPETWILFQEAWSFHMPSTIQGLVLQLCGIQIAKGIIDHFKWTNLWSVKVEMAHGWKRLQANPPSPVVWRDLRESSAVAKTSLSNSNSATCSFMLQSSKWASKMRSSTHYVRN